MAAAPDVDGYDALSFCFFCASLKYKSSFWCPASHIFSYINWMHGSKYIQMPCTTILSHLKMTLKMPDKLLANPHIKRISGNQGSVFLFYSFSVVLDILVNFWMVSFVFHFYIFISYLLLQFMPPYLFVKVNHTPPSTSTPLHHN